MWFFRLSGHHKYFPKSEDKIETTFGIFDCFVLFPTYTCSGKLYKSVIRCKYMVDLPYIDLPFFRKIVIYYL